MKRVILIALCVGLLSACGIQRDLKRPADIERERMEEQRKAQQERNGSF